MKEPLYLLDGYALIYKSYYAFINRPMLNPDGKNTSAVFGFFRSLIAFFRKYKPTRFAVIMDSRVPTFRHEMYAEYKATREKTPEDLHAQVPVIEEILNVMGIPSIKMDRYEADDIIASLAELCSKESRPCFIISGDKDLLQLVGEFVKILKPEKGEYIEQGTGDIFSIWGVKPDQILDYLSLTGDQADNIPGVKGIGPKSAVKLLSDFDTLEGVYNNIDKCSKTQSLKLNAGKDAAFMSRKLIILKKDLQVNVLPDDLSVVSINPEAADPIFEREGIKTLSGKLHSGGLSITPLKAEAIVPEGQKGEYEAVTTLEALDRWIALVKKNKWFSFDTETDNINDMDAVPVGFSLSVESGKGCYIPLIAGGKEFLLTSDVKERLKDILEDPDLKLIGQNIKYDYKVLKRWGIDIKNITFDTMIAAWLLDPQSSMYGMDKLADTFLNYKTLKFKDIVPKGETFDSVSLNEAVEYAAEDADITFRLYKTLKLRLEEEKLDKLFSDIEMPLVKILADIELKGIRIEPEELSVFGRELAQQLQQLEDKIWIECGKTFNIRSPKQLQVVLFEERGLKPTKKTKSGYSTDISVLEVLSLEDIVPEMILSHRKLSKLKSTYVDALPELINKRTGRIHTSLIQTGTATGRLSSREPNLQNIPVKTEEGRRIRSAFSAPDGYQLLSADYSQIELVVFAVLSEDPVLKNAFLTGQDIHALTGSLIFDIDTAEVTLDQRRIAKTINFGVMYGMSPFRLSQELKISRADAKFFIDSYFEKYSKVKEYISNKIAETEKDGYVKTLLGRKRDVPEINSRNRTIKMGAERIAVNTPVQGTAADIMKLAMIKIIKRLEKEDADTKLILQIHDELIFEVPENELSLITCIVKEEMESAIEFAIPLKVSIETGSNWGEFH